MPRMRWKRRVGAFAAAAALLLAYSAMRVIPAKKAEPPPGSPRRTSTSRTATEARTRTAEWRRLSRTLGMWNRTTESNGMGPPEDFAASIELELPYDSLNCALEPGGRYKRQIPMAGILGERGWMLSLADDFQVQLTRMRTVLDSVYVQRPYGFAPYPDAIGMEIDQIGDWAGSIASGPEFSGQAGGPLKQTLEVEPLRRMAAAGDGQGLVRTIQALDRLRMEWMDEHGAQTLLDRYLDTYQDAGPDGQVPNGPCLVRNGQALRLLYFARSALARMMSERPAEAGGLLNQLPELQRIQTLYKLGVELLAAGQEPATAERVFGMLPPENQAIFLELLEHRAWNAESIARAGANAAEQSFLELRERLLAQIAARRRPPPDAAVSGTETEGNGNVD